jgi:hypothetical protein
MAFHKLADGPITMVIGAVKSAEGKFGPQMVFSSIDGTDVYISELSGAKGLARLNLTPESVLGQTLHFEQIRKDGKTFTNINLATGSAPTGGATAAPATRTASTASALSFDDAVALYAKCVDAAIQHLGKKCEQAEIPVDGAAIQSAAATLFIRTSK